MVDTRTLASRRFGVPGIRVCLCVLGTTWVLACAGGEIDDRDEGGSDPAAAAERYELVILQAECDSTGAADVQREAGQASVPTAEAPPPVPVGVGASVPQTPAQPVVLDPDGRFAVQVGSFRARAGADRLVAELAAEGYPAYRVPGPRGEGYRVRIGFFRSRADAEAFGSIFKADRKMEFWVDRRQDGE
jgi:cell division septation protein DedD